MERKVGQGRYALVVTACDGGVQRSDRLPGLQQGYDTWQVGRIISMQEPAEVGMRAATGPDVHSSCTSACLHLASMSQGWDVPLGRRHA